jgi:hypothetical protein
MGSSCMRMLLALCTTELTRYTIKWYLTIFIVAFTGTVFQLISIKPTISECY